MNDAFRWWNHVVNFEESLEDPPNMPDVTEMNIIWLSLSPIFHTHCIPSTDDSNYWAQVQKCLQILSQDDKIPNPLTDFHGFVFSIFSYRNLIKINDTDGAILYAQRFCQRNDSTFFVKKFLCSVSDPFLAVEAMDKMNTLEMDTWISYIRQPGAIERIFDLFITFLQPANRSVENEYEGFRVMLANLMTSLICRSDSEMFRRAQYASSLYLRLLNLIIYSQTDASVSFARCAIQINNSFLKACDPEERAKRVIALLNVSPPGKLPHFMITKFAISQGGVTIPNFLLAQQFSHNIQTEWDLIALNSINLTSKEARFIILRAITQTMTQNKYLMRLAAKFLVELLIKIEDQDLQEWAQKYFVLLFVMIKLCAKKMKYMRRVLMICDVVSQDQFLSITNIKKIILPCANACYQKGGCEFLLDYFPLSSEFPQSQVFLRELQRYESGRIKLKTFPFKGQSNNLVEGRGKKGDGDGNEIPLEKRVFMHDDFADLQISKKAKPYLYRRTRISSIDQQNTIFQLEDFIDQNKAKAEKIKSKTRHKRSTVNTKHFITSGVIQVVGLRCCLHNNEVELSEFQYKILMDFIEIANELIQVLRQLPDLNADIRYLQYDLQHYGLDDNYYKSLKEQRMQLRSLVPIFSREYIAPKYVEELSTFLSTQTVRFDQQLQYVPPNEVDFLLVEYLKRSSYSEILDATAEIIESGTIDGAVSTIWELNNSLIDMTKIIYNQNVMVLYNSILRAVFDNAYIVNKRPHLNRYKKANYEFLERAKKLSEQPISFLNFKDSIQGAKRVNQPISSLLVSSKFSLEQLEFYTNPIDIIYQIHLQCQQLQSLSTTGVLSPLDHQMLMLALVATYPPVNAISIAIFLEKWGTIVSNGLLSKSLSLFINAVSGIMNLKSVVDDE